MSSSRWAYQKSMRPAVRASSSGKRSSIFARKKASVDPVAMIVTATEVHSAAAKTEVMIREGRLANGRRTIARTASPIRAAVPLPSRAVIAAASRRHRRVRAIP